MLNVMKTDHDFLTKELIKQGELQKLSRKEMQPRMFFLVGLFLFDITKSI